MNEILSKVFYDGYYVIKTQETRPPGVAILSEIAYNLNDEYIGDAATAKYLCKDKKIVPELATLAKHVCSIGFSEEHQKWYGWSHRAIWGFTIGSKITKGDSGYRTSDKQELLRELKTDHDYASDHCEIKETSEGWTITMPAETLTESDSLEEDDSDVKYKTKYETKYEYTLGRGEWTAETLEDAKQMAIDFAESVG